MADQQNDDFTKKFLADIKSSEKTDQGLQRKTSDPGGALQLAANAAEDAIRGLMDPPATGISQDSAARQQAEESFRRRMRGKRSSGKGTIHISENILKNARKRKSENQLAQLKKKEFKEKARLKRAHQYGIKPPRKAQVTPVLRKGGIHKSNTANLKQNGKNTKIIKTEDQYFFRIKSGYTDPYAVLKNKAGWKPESSRAIKLNRAEVRIIASRGPTAQKAEIAGMMRAKMYRKKQITFYTPYGVRTFAYGKVKIRTDDYYGVRSFRSFVHGTNVRTVDYLKKAGQASGRSIYQTISHKADASLQEGGLAGEVVTSYEALYKGTKIALKNVPFALKTTARIGAGAGVKAMTATANIAWTAMHPKQAGNIMISRVRANLNIVKFRAELAIHTVGNAAKKTAKAVKEMTDGVRRLAQQLRKKRFREIAGAGARAGGRTLIKIGEALAKFAVAAIVNILGWLAVLLAPFFIILLTAFLILFMIMLIFAKNEPIYDTADNFEAYLYVVSLCNEYEEEWKIAMEKMEEDFLLPQPDGECPYGNYNTFELLLTCDSEHDEDAVKGYMVDPEDVYCLTAAKYEGMLDHIAQTDVRIDPAAPSKEELDGYIRGILEVLNPYDYMESDRFDIYQELYACHEEYTEETMEEYGFERVEFISTHEKPDIYYPRYGLYFSDEEFHLFLKTEVTYHLESFTYVLMTLEDKEVRDRYREYRSCFQSWFTGWEADALDLPAGFMDNIHNRSGLDQTSSLNYVSTMNDFPILPVDRESFGEQVKSYCDGSIPYVWGGSSESGCDCSGFICLMFRKAGHDISGNTAWLWEHSYAIDADEAQVGDLVFKQAPSSNGINHAGIVYDNSDEEDCLFMHCAGSTGSVINNYEGFVMYRRLPVWFDKDVERK